MADTEDLDILIRLRGGRVAASEAKAVDKALAGIGTSAKGVAKETENLNQGQRRLGVTFGNTIGIAIRYAAAYAGIHKAIQAIGSGFAFDSAMEQNTIAFTQFLGSAKAADQYLKELYQIAATTPFQFADVTMGAKKLIAMGADANEAKDELITLADAASALGVGQEGINRLVLAIGQIRAAGRVQGDEVRQLQEAGINAYKYLIDAGLLTQKQVGNLGNLNIDAAKGIAAIMAGMQRDFGGMSAAQARTWQGQLSTIKDYAAQAAGALVKPIFDLGRSNILPAISKELQKWTKYLNSGGADDIYAALGKVLKIMAPLIAAFVAYRTALWGAAAAQTALTVATAAWLALGELAAVAALVPAITSVADVTYLLTAAVTALGLSATAVATLGVSLLIAALVAAYIKFQWFRDGVNTAVRGIILIGKVMATPYILAFKAIVWAAKGAINFLIGAWNSLSFTVPRVDLGPLGSYGGQTIGVPKIKMLADGGDVRAGGTAIVGEAGPEVLQNRGGVATVTPLGGGRGGGGGRILQPLILQIEGRTFAKVMVDIAETEAARG